MPRFTAILTFPVAAMRMLLIERHRHRVRVGFLGLAFALLGIAMIMPGISIFFEKPISAQTTEPLRYHPDTPLDIPPNNAPPKNIIIMIADGGGFNHFEATSYYKYGQPKPPVFTDAFKTVPMCTYSQGRDYDPRRAWGDIKNVKHGVTDSAAAATAMATGRKTNNGALGLSPEGIPLENILERAKSHGKAAGVVTTVQFSHATPAGFAAHIGSRNSYAEIAQTMLVVSSLDVIMGCGHPQYDDNGNIAEEEEYRHVGGKALWESVVDGTIGNDMDSDGSPDKWNVLQTRDQFRSLAASTASPKRVLGVAQVRETLQQKRNGIDNDTHDDLPYQTPVITSVPTLAEMTSGALNVLKQNPKGFVMMVEGGAIDWASHENQLGRMIEELADFDEAVKLVVNWIEAESDWSETMLVVTADHETGCLMGARQGTDWPPVKGNGVGRLPDAQWFAEGHTNTLVPIFARGSGVELFDQCIRGFDSRRGHYVDNTDIAKIVFGLLDDNAP